MVTVSSWALNYAMSQSKDPGQGFTSLWNKSFHEIIMSQSWRNPIPFHPALPGLRGSNLGPLCLHIKVNKGTDYWLCLGREPDSGVATYVVVRQCLLPFIVTVHDSHVTLVLVVSKCQSSILLPEGKHAVKRQLYSEPFTLWKATSFIFQH